MPNAFAAWALVDALLTRLKGLGWDAALIGRLAGFIINELRTVLASERDRQAATLFTEGLANGRITFALRGDRWDWTAPDEIWTTQPVNATQLQAETGGPLERSLFLPIYAADLNDEERSFAVYLDKDHAVRWWHRNGTVKDSYAVRGWRRGNVYPDFLFAALREGATERIVVIETKGEHLAGNHDTAYKTALLDRLTAAFGIEAAGEGMRVGRAAFDFGAAVVLFSEKDGRMPALIRGGL